jgi:hypothetical protein
VSARRLSHPLPAAALLAALAGCATSPAPRRAATHDVPRGASVVLDLVDRRRHAGELLALRDSSLVLLLPTNRVAVARVADVGRVDWGNYSASGDFGARVWTTPQLQAHVRSASRFPFGLPDAALRTLLAGLGQAAPDTLRAGAP